MQAILITSAYLKRRIASCRYNFTLSLSFSYQGRGPSGHRTLFNFFASTFPQSDNLLTNSYADDFTVWLKPLVPINQILRSG